jgi:hypothetical protein
MKSVKFACSRYVPWFLSFYLVFFFRPTHALSQNSPASYTVLTSSKYSATPLRMNEVNRTAIRHFRANFSSTGNEQWYKVDDFYMANFFDGQIRGKAYYKSRGGFAFCMKFYDATLLDPDTRFLIMKKFENYKIDVVTEITNLEEKFYFIKIKSSTNIKTLKVLDGNIEVTEDFSNAGT